MIKRAVRLVELGAILDDTTPGRTDGRQITIADLTGIAAQDIAIANAVLDSSGRGGERAISLS